MLSNSIRPKAGYPVFAVVALLASLWPVRRSFASPTNRSGSEGPCSFVAARQDAPRPTSCPPSDNATQSDKSAPTDSTAPSVEGAADENKTGTKANNESESKMRPEPAGQGEPAIKADKPATSEKKSEPQKGRKRPKATSPTKPPSRKEIRESGVGESRDGRRAVGPGHDQADPGRDRGGHQEARHHRPLRPLPKLRDRQGELSAGRYTGSELAGNCRLKWYDHLMRNMLAAPAEAEQFTRELHMAVCNEPRRACARCWRWRRQRWTSRPRKPRKAVQP